MYAGYWSSPESDTGWAWFYWMGYGTYVEWKGATMNVRRVRKD